MALGKSEVAGAVPPQSSSGRVLERCFGWSQAGAEAEAAKAIVCLSPRTEATGGQQPMHILPSVARGPPGRMEGEFLTAYPRV